MVMFLDEARVAELLSWERLIPAMEQALADLEGCSDLGVNTGQRPDLLPCPA